MNNEWRDYSFSANAIKKMARRVVNRRLNAMAAAHSDTIGDIEQELNIAWLQAIENYDPSFNVPFLAYLEQGMRNHINRYIKKTYERQPTTGCMVASLDEAINSEEGKTTTLQDVLPDASQGHDVLFEQESVFNLIWRNLSERARQFLQILKDQPRELIECLGHFNAKAKFAREQGINYAAAQRISAHTVFSIMGANRGERNRIIKEINGLVNSVSTIR